MTVIKRVAAAVALVLVLAGCGGPELLLSATEPPVTTPPVAPSEEPCPPVIHGWKFDGPGPDDVPPVADCPTPAPTPAAPAGAETSPRETTPAEPVPVQEPAPASPAAEPVYENCDDVREAGKAPIREGEPGFQDKFDSDDDGVGCEVT